MSGYENAFTISNPAPGSRQLSGPRPSIRHSGRGGPPSTCHVTGPGHLRPVGEAAATPVLLSPLMTVFKLQDGFSLIPIIATAVGIQVSSAPTTLIFLGEGLEETPFPSGKFKAAVPTSWWETLLSAGSLGDALPAPCPQDATLPLSPAPSPGMAPCRVDNLVQTPSVRVSSKQPGQTPQRDPRAQRCPFLGLLILAQPVLGLPAPPGTWNRKEAVLHVPQEGQVLGQGWEWVTTRTLPSGSSREQRLLICEQRPQNARPWPPQHPAPPGSQGPVQATSTEPPSSRTS